MRLIRTVRVVACFACIGSASGAEDPIATPASVALADIASAPDEYEGVEVRVAGYLRIGSENPSLCPRAAQAAGKDCVWLDIDTRRWGALSGKRVVVTGPYSARRSGHLGCCSGTIGPVADVSPK
jgi:hypothetical protein